MVGIRADPRTEPLEGAGSQLWTDGSSFVKDGKRYTGLAVASKDGSLLLRQLPSHWSTQVAELLALIEACHLSEGLPTNIYTDSHYVFLSAHTHAAVWKARGFTGADGKCLKMKPLLEELVKVIREPSELAIFHYRDHQTDCSEISHGNHAADYWARQATVLGPAIHSEKNNLLALFSCDPIWHLPALYDDRDKLDPEGKWCDRWWIVQNRVQLSQQMVWKLVQRAHQMSHGGPRPLQTWLISQYCNPNLQSLCKTVVSQCDLCQRNNP